MDILKKQPAAVLGFAMYTNTTIAGVKLLKKWVSLSRMMSLSHTIWTKLQRKYIRDILVSFSLSRNNCWSSYPKSGPNDCKPPIGWYQGRQHAFYRHFRPRVLQQRNRLSVASPIVLVISKNFMFWSQLPQPKSADQGIYSLYHPAEHPLNCSHRTAELSSALTSHNLLSALTPAFFESIQDRLDTSLGRLWFNKDGWRESNAFKSIIRHETNNQALHFNCTKTCSISEQLWEHGNLSELVCHRDFCNCK